MKIFKCVGEVIVLIILFLMLIPIAILEEILSRKKVTTSPSHSPLMVGGGTKICGRCCRLPSQCICNKKKGTDK